jgi:hypothetical protein
VAGGHPGPAGPGYALAAFRVRGRSLPGLGSFTFG